MPGAELGAGNATKRTEPAVYGASVWTKRIQTRK